MQLDFAAQAQPSPIRKFEPDQLATAKGKLLERTVATRVRYQRSHFQPFNKTLSARAGGQPCGHLVCKSRVDIVLSKDVDGTSISALQSGIFLNYFWTIVKFAATGGYR